MSSIPTSSPGDKSASVMVQNGTDSFIQQVKTAEGAGKKGEQRLIFRARLFSGYLQ